MLRVLLLHDGYTNIAMRSLSSPGEGPEKRVVRLCEVFFPVQNDFVMCWCLIISFTGVF